MWKLNGLAFILTNGFDVLGEAAPSHVEQLKGFLLEVNFLSDCINIKWLLNTTRV